MGSLAEEGERGEGREVRKNERRVCAGRGDGHGGAETLWGAPPHRVGGRFSVAGLWSGAGGELLEPGKAEDGDEALPTAGWGQCAGAAQLVDGEADALANGAETLGQLLVGDAQIGGVLLFRHLEDGQGDGAGDAVERGLRGAPLDGDEPGRLASDQVAHDPGALPG